MKRLPVLSYYSGGSGTYISVMPTGRSIRILETLRRVLEPMGFSGLHPALNWHATVIYSKDDVSEVADLHNQFDLSSDREFVAVPDKVEYWDGHKEQGVIVLKIKSDELKELHYGLRDLGLKVTFPDYEAHITLVEDALEDHTKEECEQVVETLNQIVESTLTGRELRLTGLKIEDVS